MIQPPFLDPDASEIRPQPRRLLHVRRRAERGSDRRLVLDLAHLFAIQWEQCMCLPPVCYVYAQRLPMVGGSTKMNTCKYTGILDLVSCRSDA